MPTDYRVGDVIRLARPHPCGGFDWTVVRIGADIGLRCTMCQRRVLLERAEVDRRFRSFVTRSPGRDPFEENAALTDERRASTDL